MYDVLAEQLFRCNAVQFGAFKLKLHETNPDAPLSPIYFNLRTSDNPKPGPLTPDITNLACHALAHLIAIHGLADYRFVAGVPNAADPFVAGLCQIMPNAFTQLKLLKSERNGQRCVDQLDNPPTVAAGTRVLLLDDLITKADSKLEAINTLARIGLTVEDVVVLIDRAQGGKEELAKHNVRLHCIWTIHDLLKIYRSLNLISSDTEGKVLDYLAHN